VCLAVLVLILAYLLATCGPLTELEKTSERPNVILLLSDDLDTPLLEEHSANYPNLGRLAAEGLTFENAFVTDPLCCPSRATFLRSQYAHNHQIVGNWWPRGGSKKSQALGHEESTVATWLQDGGYRTVLIGKYMNDYYGTHVPDEWYGIAGGYRTDDLNENGRIEHYDPDRYHLDDVLDEMIGHLMETLKESEELDNTYIFFTSDNGYHMGQHRLTAGKWTAYEEDTRVPLIVRGPGVPKGRTLSHLVLNNDLAPTFAKLAEVSVPTFVDGRSLKPVLGEDPPPPEEWRQAFLVEAASELGEHSRLPPLSGDAQPGEDRRTVPGEDWGRPGLEAVRTADHLYVEYKTGERELYDLEEDPYQLMNQYDTADPSLVRRMEERLETLRGCAGATCKATEDGH